MVRVLPKKLTTQKGNAMKNLIHQLKDRVMGVLSGFDRLVFRGILRCVIDARGLNGHLYGAKIQMTDYEQYVKRVSRQIVKDSLLHAQKLGREIRYLESSKDRKKDIALSIAERDQIDNGLVCVLKSVEPCMSFHVHRDKEKQEIALRPRLRKCLHLYHYYLHPDFGLMHVRLQTWFPMTMQVYLNGREWLAKSLIKARIPFLKRDNCICHVDDIQATQKLFDQQLKTNWIKLLNRIQKVVHPAHDIIFRNCPEDVRQYYWGVHQSEWASDLLFKDPSDAFRLAEHLAKQSIQQHGAGDVMRFLGRIPTASGLPRHNFKGEIISDVQNFEQGFRVKHRFKTNSVKMYNRPGVLRFETTINDPTEFKVFRTKENDPDGPEDWLKMRKGVADLHRRAEVSQAANDRFATAQAAQIDEEMPLKELADSLCRPTTRPGHRRRDGTRTKTRKFRALNPFSRDDLLLLETVADPKFLISGLRNQDIRDVLWQRDAKTQKEKRKRSSAVSRKLLLLRAHGILEKISKSHKYRVTAKGRQALTSLLTAANANTNQLTSLAA